jgi:hypothetical protein
LRKNSGKNQTESAVYYIKNKAHVKQYAILRYGIMRKYKKVLLYLFEIEFEIFTVHIRAKCQFITREISKNCSATIKIQYKK